MTSRERVDTGALEREADARKGSRLERDGLISGVAGRPTTYAELFAGVQGFGMGFERAGMECLWAVEIDNKCQDVIRYHNPDLPLWGDVRTFQPDDWPCPDVIRWGSPCQGLSVAGHRKGLKDERSQLFYEGIRVIHALRGRGLRFSVWENVPGALSANESRDFSAALHEFWKCGGSVAWRVLDGQHFALAQRRRRVFVVLDLGGDRAQEVLSIAEGMSGHPAPCREAGQSVAASLTSGSHPGSNAPGRRREDDENLAVCLRAKSNSSHRADTETFVPQVESPIVFNHRASAARQQPVRPGDLAGTLDGSDAEAVAFTCSDQANSYAWETDVHPTLNAQVPNDTSNIQYGIRRRMEVRRLMPIERERVQGWPDDWTRWGRRQDGSAYEIKDGPRYEMTGNGVQSNVSEWIGLRLMEALGRIAA